MDLEQFAADARAAFATGRYRLVTGQFGTGPRGCCLVLMVLLHWNARPAHDQQHTDLAARRYGGDQQSWWSLLCGYDGVGAADTAHHPAAWRLGRRLAEEFNVPPRKDL